MIGRLRGTLIAKQPPSLVVDVGGVGYELEAPMSTFFDLPETGRDVALFTHYAVKEDTAVLYGFLREGERTLFRTLQKVSGIGAKISLAVLVRRQHRRVRAADPAGRRRRADAHSRDRQEDRRAHAGRASRSRQRSGAGGERGRRGTEGSGRRGDRRAAGARLQAGRSVAPRARRGGTRRRAEEIIRKALRAALR